MLAELGDEEVDQPAAVLVLLGRHFRENFGARRVVLEESVGEVGIDAAVLLLVADGEGQHLALGQLVEIAHGGVLGRSGDVESRR